MKRFYNLLTLPFRRPAVAQTPADVIYRENKLSLLRYRARPGGPAFATPVLMVPSLINRHYVMDLMPQKSMAEHFVARGHDVWIIDWGTPGGEDRYLGFDDVMGYLARAARTVARSSPRGEAHLLGYCLGGTLTAIHAATGAPGIASLTALAAPVAFDDGGLLATWTRSPQFDVDALVDGFGNVPWPLMQGAFQLLRPTLNLAKAVSLLHRAWDDEFLDGFLALETWGNDNVSFPGECYRRYVKELYRADALVAGTFSVRGQPARLERIACPVLGITFEHDHIVPAASAAVLLERVASTDTQRIHRIGGHVGAATSKAAARELWPEMSAFWAARDGAPAPATRKAPATPGAGRARGGPARATSSPARS